MSEIEHETSWTASSEKRVASKIHCQGMVWPVMIHSNIVGYSRNCQAERQGSLGFRIVPFNKIMAWPCCKHFILSLFDPVRCNGRGAIKPPMGARPRQ